MTLVIPFKDQKHSGVDRLQNEKFFFCSFLKPAFKQHVLEDPHLEKFLKHPFYPICQAIDEAYLVPQSYMNSCIAAVFTEEVHLKTPHILSRILLGKLLHETLVLQISTLKESTPWIWKKDAWPKGPSIEELCAERMHCNEVAYQAIKESLKNLLSGLPDFDSKKGFKKTYRKLQNQWASYFQNLLSLAHLSDPEWGNDKDSFISINTPFFLTRQWGINQFRIHLSSLIQSLIPYNKQPRLKEDRQEKGYISYSGCLNLLNPHLYLSAPEDKLAYHLRIDSHLQEALVNDKSHSFLSSLWESLKQNGGARVESRGHAYFLNIEHTHNTTLSFSLYDPLIPSLQKLSPHQITQLFIQTQWDIFIDCKQLAL